MYFRHCPVFLTFVVPYDVSSFSWPLRTVLYQGTRGLLQGPLREAWSRRFLRQQEETFIVVAVVDLVLVLFVNAALYGCSAFSVGHPVFAISLTSFHFEGETWAASNKRFSLAQATRSFTAKDDAKKLTQQDLYWGFFVYRYYSYDAKGHTQSPSWYRGKCYE